MRRISISFPWSTPAQSLAITPKHGTLLLSSVNGAAILSGKKNLASAVSDYGADTKAKLSSPTVTGAPEDQLRNPLETLFKELAEIAGYPSATVNLVGEVTLAALSTRPDFAVTRSKKSSPKAILLGVAHLSGLPIGGSLKPSATKQTG